MSTAPNAISVFCAKLIQLYVWLKHLLRTVTNQMSYSLCGFVGSVSVLSCSGKIVTQRGSFVLNRLQPQEISTCFVKQIAEDSFKTR